MSTSQAIRSRIASHPSGEPFTPALFAGLGSRAAIDQALMRLARAGEIERIGHGLYLVAEVSRFGVKVLPSAEQVAQAVARAEGATIGVHGAEAALRFGLTTQMPTQPVFYTTGSTRSIRLGKMRLKLYHVTARKLALAGRPAGQALSALWYLGKEHVTPSTLHRIAQLLPPDEFHALSEAKTAMPFWMLEVFNDYKTRNKANHV